MVFSSQFWKFVITGAENNTELKVWGCVDWTCLQTVKFAPDSVSTKTGMYLKAGLDLGARHLLLSDIYNQVISVAIGNYHKFPKRSNLIVL